MAKVNGREVDIGTPMGTRTKTRKKLEYKKIEIEIVTLLDDNHEKLFRRPKPDLNPIERAAGYTNSNRKGSKGFTDAFGTRILEPFWALGSVYTVVKKKGDKGSNDLFGVKKLAESKSRYNTMKASESVKEIEPKLAHAIKNGDEFYLLVLTDKPKKKKELQEIAKSLDIDFKGLSKEELMYILTEISDDCYVSRDIPLHEGRALSKIKDVEGYDPQKHRWLSGLKAIRHCFPEHDPRRIRQILLDKVRETAKAQDQI